jgi:hypothetical protein
VPPILTILELLRNPGGRRRWQRIADQSDDGCLISIEKLGIGNPGARRGSPSNTLNTSISMPKALAVKFAESFHLLRVPSACRRHNSNFSTTH